jgi:hypothetical protein
MPSKTRTIDIQCIPLAPSSTKPGIMPLTALVVRQCVTCVPTAAWQSVISAPSGAAGGHPGPAASSRVSNDISGILGCFYWAPGLHDALGGLLA